MRYNYIFKKMKFVASLALAAATANGAWNSCTPGDYKTMITSFAQGLQMDPTSKDTDCYGKADILANKTEQFFTSFSNFEIANWAAPLYIMAETTVATTDVFAFCQTTNFAKQLSTRMSSLSGFFDFFTTIGTAFLKDYIAPGKSNLYNAMYSFAMTDSSCDAAAVQFG